jgi:hypothetical protein
VLEKRFLMSEVPPLSPTQKTTSRELWMFHPVGLEGP